MLFTNASDMASEPDRIPASLEGQGIIELLLISNERQRGYIPCIAYTADGFLCRAPAAILDQQRHGMVCTNRASTGKSASRMGVKVSQIYLRPMARKWASISTRGRLTLNTEILTW
jgi:hypothetical protein